jgi:hypothetical protein
MNTKQQGNLALARSIAHFSANEYSIFLPIGDSAGAIDIVVSPDGIHLLRVQCKYTEHLHSEMSKRHPERMMYEVNLRQVKERVDRLGIRQPVYEKDAFDLLFISTPQDDYLINWTELCDERGKVPSGLILGKKTDQYKIKQ